MTADRAADAGGFADRTSSGRRAVDWIIAVVLILFGLAMTGLGGFLVGITDRELFEELVAEENFHSDVFTEAELVDLMVAGNWWAGVGVVTAGLGMVLVGALFGLGRHRIDRLEPGEPAPTFVANALLGAVVTSLTSFVPLSGLIGGGAAGYLETTDSGSGAIVGGTSGLLVIAPIAIIGLLLMIGFAVEGFVTIGMLLFVAIIFLLAFAIGLGAAGGAVGAYLRGREGSDESTDA